MKRKYVILVFLFSLITEAIPVNLILTHKLGPDNALYFFIIILSNLILLYYANCELIKLQVKSFTKSTVITIIGLFSTIVSVEVIFGIINNYFYHQTISRGSARIGESLQSGNYIVVITFFVLVIYSPIIETLLFQGLPQVLFEPNKKVFFSISTSIVFSLLHVPNNPIIFFEYLISGFLLQYFALNKENGIFKVIIVHALLNVLSFISYI